MKILKLLILVSLIILSHDVASGSDITPCIKINNPFFVVSHFDVHFNFA